MCTSNFRARFQGYMHRQLPLQTVVVPGAHRLPQQANDIVPDAHQQFLVQTIGVPGVHQRQANDIVSGVHMPATSTAD